MYKDDKLFLTDAEKYANSKYEQDIRKKLADELYKKYEPKIEDFYDYVTVMQKLESSHIVADDRQVWASRNYSYPWAFNAYLSASRRMQVIEDTQDMLKDYFDVYASWFEEEVDKIDIFYDAYKVMNSLECDGHDYENDADYELTENDFKKSGI